MILTWMIFFKEYSYLRKKKRIIFSKNRRVINANRSELYAEYWIKLEEIVESEAEEKQIEEDIVDFIDFWEDDIFNEK